jgi:hypothetical protein
MQVCGLTANIQGKQYRTLLMNQLMKVDSTESDIVPEMTSELFGIHLVWLA